MASEARATDGDVIRLEDGELTLIEVDTSARYEASLEALVKDFQAEKRGVFLISGKGSRLHSAFSSVTGVKLYTMSESARYVSPSPTNPDEVNVPLFDSGYFSTCSIGRCPPPPSPRP